MKKIIAILLVIFLMCLCTGCGNTVEKASTEEPSMFVEIERTGAWVVVYHKETKVMYTVSRGGYNSGNFTLLVNADGTPLLYDGE